MEKLAYGHSIEALLKAVRPVLDVALTKELQALGIDPTKQLLPAYSVDVMRNALALGARRLNPTLSTEQAFVALGRRYIDTYAETLVGRALLAAIRLIGPRRTLERLARQFRTANNYSETKVTHLAPGHSELWCNDVAHPHWYVGLVTRMMETAGATGVQVTLRTHDAAGAFFDVRWST